MAGNPPAESAYQSSMVKQSLADLRQRLGQMKAEKEAIERDIGLYAGN